VVLLLLVLIVIIGPFGFSVIGLSVGAIVFPLTLVSVVIALVGQGVESRLGISLLVLVGGWMVTILAAAVLAGTLLVLPEGLNSDLAPLPTWLVLLSPVFCVGVCAGAVAQLVQERKAIASSGQMR